MSVIIISSVDSEISQIASHMLENARKGVKQAGETLKEKSVFRTPVDTGELRSRAFVSPVDEENGTISVAVGYEGKNEEPKYAVYVHERTELHHRIGQAKFLESALHEMYSEFFIHLKEVLMV